MANIAPPEGHLFFAKGDFLIENRTFLISFGEGIDFLCFTFIKYDNTQITVDLPIETTVKSGRYDATTHKLILVLMSDDTVEIPVSDLVDVYTGDTNTQIQVVVKSGNIIEAILRKGSITEEYLDSDLVEKVNDNRNIAFATFDIDLETGSLIMYTNKQMDLEFRLSQETGNMEVLI